MDPRSHSHLQPEPGRELLGPAHGQLPAHNDFDHPMRCDGPRGRYCPSNVLMLSQQRAESPPQRLQGRDVVGKDDIMKAIQLVILPRAMVTPPEDQPPPDNQPPPPPPPPQNQEQDPEDEKEEDEDEEDEEPPEDQEEEVLPCPAVQPAGGLKGRCMQTTVSCTHWVQPCGVSF